jgi:regulator of sigma D
MTIFDKYPITKLTKNETDFMIDIMIQLPTTILNQKSVSENRKIDGKLKDNTEEISKDFNDNEIERDNELMEFNKSFRVIEVL